MEPKKSKRSKKSKKSNSKRTRREPHPVAASEPDIPAPSKADLVRGYLRENPSIEYYEVSDRLRPQGLSISLSYFVRIWKQYKEQEQPAAICCGYRTDESTEVDPFSPLVTVDQVLRAQQIIERAYLAAWAEVGQDFEAVDKIVTSVHTKHRDHKALQPV